MGMLDGRAVVITGAGRGLGAAFAVHAAVAGAAVVVNDIDGELAEEVAAGIRERGGRAVASSQSVREPDQADAVIDRCLAEFGALDGLVNNAALNYEALPWEDDPERVRELIEVNVLGVLFCGMAAARVMRRSRTGSIVNISSGSSFGQHGMAAYAASKGAVASVTYAWALDLEPVGVRVNAVCPSARTRMVEASPRASLDCPLERTPDKIAPLITFLLSEQSDGITGQLLRFLGDQLHVVRQPGVKEPVLHRERWAAEDIATAFDLVLYEHLEPYGLEKRLPQRAREPEVPRLPAVELGR